MRQPPASHGTYSGYRLHYYYGTKPCEACRRAKRDYTRQARARQRNGLQPGPPVLRVPCTRGLGWPAEAHRVEGKALTLSGGVF